MEKMLPLRVIAGTDLLETHQHKRWPDPELQRQMDEGGHPPRHPLAPPSAMKTAEAPSKRSRPRKHPASIAGDVNLGSSFLELARLLLHADRNQCLLLRSGANVLRDLHRTELRSAHRAEAQAQDAEGCAQVIVSVAGGAAVPPAMIVNGAARSFTFVPFARCGD